MMALSLFDQYDKLVVFDTETTGLAYSRDQIIEFAAAVVTPKGVEEEYDAFVALAPGTSIPPKITELTGITEDMIRAEGRSKAQVCGDMARLFAGDRVLLCAYNAHFDLSFLYYMLLRDGDPAVLKGKDKLDLLTVYKDRRPYPHRLHAAIDAYHLGDSVRNSHRAIDDVLATVAVMEAMAAERDDLIRYINLFGYNAKYGIEGKPISTVHYIPQGYHQREPLYELAQSPDPSPAFL